MGIQGCPQLRLQRLPHDVERVGRLVLLKTLEGGDVLLGEHVRTRAQDLAQLDEGGSQLNELIDERLRSHIVAAGFKAPPATILPIAGSCDVHQVDETCHRW